jgi:hypothetical protein
MMIAAARSLFLPGAVGGDILQPPQRISAPRRIGDRCRVRSQVVHQVCRPHGAGGKADFALFGLAFEAGLGQPVDGSANRMAGIKHVHTDHAAGGGAEESDDRDRWHERPAARRWPRRDRRSHRTGRRKSRWRGRRPIWTPASMPKGTKRPASDSIAPMTSSHARRVANIKPQPDGDRQQQRQRQGQQGAGPAAAQGRRTGSLGFHRRPDFRHVPTIPESRPV